jgi:hypothetical protein
MLTHYFSDPVMLDLIQHTPAAAYLDCLSAELVATGYKRTTIQSYLRAAAHVLLCGVKDGARQAFACSAPSHSTE